MKKFDKFLLKAFLGPFFAVLIVVTFILMIQFLWVYIDELVGKGLSFRIILEFMAWGGTTMLPLSMPLATLLASVMTIGQMSENSELIAVKASGISLARVMAPLAIVSVLISVGAFFASNNLVPHAFNEIMTLRDDIGKTKDEINIPTGAFYNGIEGYVLRVEERDKKTGMMYGVMVYDHTSNSSSSTMTLADSAMMKMSKAKDYLTLKMYNGINYQESNTMRSRDTTLQMERISFRSQELIIPLSNYAFEKSSGTRFGDQTKTKKVSVLKHEHDSLTALRDSAYLSHTDRFRNSSVLRFTSQLDTAKHFEDRPVFDYDGFFRYESLAQEKDILIKAIQQAGTAEEILTSYNNDVFDYMWTLRRDDTAFLKKYAGALACLLMFLIGAPLGSFTTRKGGLGAFLIIAALFFVLYWVVDVTGEKLAKDGAASPLGGAFISTLVLGPIGLYLSWRAIRDLKLVNADSFKAWWRKLKSKIISMFRKTRIVYMGTPEFAVAPLDALVQAGYNVVGCVTVADKPSGRGLKVNESAVKKYAVEHNIPVLQPLKLKDPEFLEQLAALKADLFVVVAFRMLPEVVWKMPPMGTFNLHAALLPQYRGAAPINWAVINGEKITGATTFMIDQEIDTGGIMLRQNCRIADDETAGDIHDKLMPIGAKLVVDTVQGIIEKNIETRVQRSFIQGSEVLKPAPKLTRELCHIDWDAPVSQVYNLVRGLSPYPTAFTEIVKDGGAPLQLKIFSSEMVTGEAYLSMCGGQAAEPGTIVSDGKTYLAIAARDGALSLKDIQLSGKKRMDVKSFLLGFREPASYSTTAGTSAAEIAKTRV